MTTTELSAAKLDEIEQLINQSAFNAPTKNQTLALIAMARRSLAAPQAPDENCKHLVSSLIARCDSCGSESNVELKSQVPDGEALLIVAEAIKSTFNEFFASDSEMRVIVDTEAQEIALSALAAMRRAVEQFGGTQQNPTSQKHITDTRPDCSNVGATLSDKNFPRSKAVTITDEMVSAAASAFLLANRANSTCGFKEMRAALEVALRIGGKKDKP